MKKIILIILGIVTFACLLAFCIFAQTTPTNNSTDKPKVTVTDGTFDITPESCIKIFNKDLKKEGLPQISQDYKSSTTDIQLTNGEGKEITQKGVIYYKANISDSLELRLISFQSLNNRIPVIELVELNKKENSTDSEIHEYFKIISSNVSPKFNADEFKISSFKNKSFDMDDITFWCGSFSSGKSHKQNMYIITTNNDLFDFYF